MLKLKSNHVLSLALATCIAAPAAFAQDAQSQSGPPQATQQEAPPAAGSQMAAKPAEKSWSELDVNNNGSLSTSEAASLASLAKVFGKADANADGELTHDEYKTWLASNSSKQQPKPGG